MAAHAIKAADAPVFTEVLLRELATEILKLRNEIATSNKIMADILDELIVRRERRGGRGDRRQPKKG